MSLDPQRMLLSRRSLCRAGLAACAAVHFSGSAHAQSGPQGCWLRGAQPFTRLDEPVRSSGHTEVDRFCSDEARTLSDLFGVRPTLLFYNDSGAPNALATPEPFDASHPDGTVLLGISLITDLFRTYRGTGSLPVVAVMAHEWGHILQFKTEFSPSWPVDYELSADNGAGWYLVKTRGLDTMESARDILAGMFAEMGSTNFNNFKFHGTPAQRRNQILSGSGLLGSIVAPEDRIAKSAEQALGLAR